MAQTKQRIIININDAQNIDWLRQLRATGRSSRDDTCGSEPSSGRIDMTPDLKILTVSDAIPLPYTKEGGVKKRVRRKDAAEFWLQAKAEAVTKKQGCYVFALKVAQGFTPWYVGKATKSFRQEVLTDNKINIYTDVMMSGAKGLPFLFFVHRQGSAAKIAKAIIDDLETFLIHRAMDKNEMLANIQKVRGRVGWGIRGVVRGGKGMRSKKAAAFSRLMGL